MAINISVGRRINPTVAAEEREERARIRRALRESIFMASLTGSFDNLDF